MSLLTMTQAWASDTDGNHWSVCDWPADERERTSAMRLLFAAFLVRHGIFTDYPREGVVDCDCGYSDGETCVCDEDAGPIAYG